MSIKLLARIDLPYIVRLEQRGDLETELPPDKDFSYFKITFSSKYLYNSDQPVCTSIEIESILNNYHHEHYPKTQIRSSTINTLEISNVIFDIPEATRNEIFKLVRHKLNNFFVYLTKVTNMFWIEDLPLNPISHVINNNTDFILLDPETPNDKRDWETIADNFMIDLEIDNIKPLNKNILNEYEDIKSTIWSTYLNKADKAIYLSEYEDFLIYCAIAGESFIKKLIEENHPLEDETLKKLKEKGKRSMVKSYFIEIMKYLYNVDFSKEKPKLYQNLQIIFKLRNDIMHKGFLDEDSYEKAGIKTLDFEESKKIISNLKKALNECLIIAKKH
ncbi:hypothetical protein [Priestia megaterium]|uniref:hypothetical protein n=1 Tax=Priestia megaterium TaxID=1404 RepID=UPI001A94DA56|nr:hypothetical protein [Priestia megaterium]QSX23922.1 hypothetical protein J0P05_29850 [Priestia megaterium]